MRPAVILRVTLYLFAGCALTLSMLAVRTYPAERTWVDDYRRWRDRDPFDLVTTRRECGWRVAFCDEFPTPTGPLAAAFDSTFGRSEAFDCEPWGEFFCHVVHNDTTLLVEFEAGDRVHWIGRSWSPLDRDRVYDSLMAALTEKHGPPFLCPQSDDLAATEDRNWQLQGRYLKIVKYLDSIIELGQGDSTIYCHTV